MRTVFVMFAGILLSSNAVAFSSPVYKAQMSDGKEIKIFCEHISLSKKELRALANPVNEAITMAEMNDHGRIKLLTENSTSFISPEFQCSFSIYSK